MKKIIPLLILLVFSELAYAKHPYPEKYYQNKWCSEWGGIAEYKLKDSARVDCLTKTYAAEFDFAPKWAEGIGQALYYAKKTGKKAALVLIFEKPSDYRYYARAKDVAIDHDITLWIMKSPEYNSSDTKTVKSDNSSFDLFAFIEQGIKFVLSNLKSLGIK